MPPGGGGLCACFSCVDSELRVGRGEAGGPPVSVWSAGRLEAKRCPGCLGPKGACKWRPVCRRMASEAPVRVTRSRLACLGASA